MVTAAPVPARPWRPACARPSVVAAASAMTPRPAPVSPCPGPTPATHPKGLRFLRHAAAIKELCGRFKIGLPHPHPLDGCPKLPNPAPPVPPAPGRITSSDTSAAPAPPRRDPREIIHIRHLGEVVRTTSILPSADCASALPCAMTRLTMPASASTSSAGPPRRDRRRSSAPPAPPRAPGRHRPLIGQQRGDPLLRRGELVKGLPAIGVGLVETAA